MLDLSLVGLIPCFVVSVATMVSFSCSNAAWHLGSLKRVYLRGTLIFMLGFGLWSLEEMGYLLECPAPVSLHSVWHISSAHALMAWSAFLKYHRGRFFGFRVQLKGWWWCPYTVWLPPDQPEQNPMIRHSQPPAQEQRPRASRLIKRRNTYCSPAVTLREPSSTKGRKHDVRALWRGASFLRASMLSWQNDSSFESAHQPPGDDVAGSPSQPGTEHEEARRIPTPHACLDC
jgi:hypothetical protein